MNLKDTLLIGAMVLLIVLMCVLAARAGVEVADLSSVWIDGYWVTVTTQVGVQELPDGTYAPVYDVENIWIPGYWRDSATVA
jgi:hypothetical protein